MSDADSERFQVLIKNLQKPVNFCRTSPETTALAMDAIKILNPCNQRLGGNLSPSIECLPFIGGEGVDVPRDRQGECRVSDCR